MDALLNSINKRQATRALLVPEKQEVVDPQAQKAAEEAARAHETHLRELQSYRERVGVHMRRLMQSDDLKFMNYPPSDAEHRFVVAVEAEKCGLVSHEFGEEGIDRFIVVYKPEFEPSDDELARLTLKHTKKMDESRIDNALKEEDTKQAEEERKEAKKRAKIAKKKEAEADETPVVLHAVGTVKRVRRGTSDAIEEIRRQKSKQAKPVDSSNTNKNNEDDAIEQLFTENKGGSHD